MSAAAAAMRLLRPLLAAAAIALAASPGWTAAPRNAPAWNQLGAEQQRILAPLQQDWETLDTVRKQKWIGVAKRYPTMTPTQQKRVQRRMEAWVKLTPEQRRQARDSYRNLSKLSPEKKQDLKKQWAEYQQLSPQERRNLDAVDGKVPARKARPQKPPADAAAQSRRTQPAPK